MNADQELLFKDLGATAEQIVEQVRGPRKPKPSLDQMCEKICTLPARIGAAHNCSATVVALAWVIRSGKVIAIPESGTAAHVMAAA